LAAPDRPALAAHLTADGTPDLQGETLEAAEQRRLQ
jgi:hypothetical protein